MDSVNMMSGVVLWMHFESSEFYKSRIDHFCYKVCSIGANIITITKMSLTMTTVLLFFGTSLF